MKHEESNSQICVNTENSNKLECIIEVEGGLEQKFALKTNPID